MLTSKKLLLLALLCLASSASADSLVYVVTIAQQFGVINLSTGSFTPIAGTPEPDANLVPAPNGNLYSVGTASGDLVAINPANGATKTIGATGLGANAFAFAGLNGNLYLTDFSNNLYRVNAGTGHATLIGPTDIPADPSIPFTFDSDGTVNFCDETIYGVGDKLYITFDSFKLNPNTLADTPQVDPELWSVDPNSGKATLIGPTTLNLSTALDLNGTYYAFHSVTTAFDPNAGPSGYMQLETLNLANGDTTFVRNIDPAVAYITGAAPVPEPGSIALALIGAGAFFIRRTKRRRL